MFQGKPGTGMFVVRTYACSPESYLYSSIMSQKSGCSYSGIMLCNDELCYYTELWESGMAAS